MTDRVDQKLCTGTASCFRHVDGGKNPHWDYGNGDCSKLLAAAEIDIIGNLGSQSTPWSKLAFRSQPCLQSDMRRRWKWLRYRLEWIGLCLATKLVPLLSRKACLHLAHAVGVLMSIFDRDGRRVALSNLEVAFGDELSIFAR